MPANPLLNVARRYLSTTARLNAKVAAPGEIDALKVWRFITLFICFPSIAVGLYYNYKQHMKHEAHFVREPFVKYSYMRVRNKKLPWGDGNHSLFHNPKVNALPDGYEDEI